MDFDPSADAYASGRGTSTLTVSGLPIQVDATALSSPFWNITFGGGGGGTTSQVGTVRLLPGPWAFALSGDPAHSFPFTVLANGTIDFDASLDAYVSGRATGRLTVSGLQFQVDATALSSADWNLSFAGFGGGTTSQVATLRLVPGPLVFMMCGAPGYSFPFTLNPDGTLGFDSSHDLYVTGRGTSTLTVSGLPITVDATALSHENFNLFFGCGGGGPRTPPSTVQLLPNTNASPGDWWFQSPPSTNNIVHFSVSAAGIIDFDPSYDPFVSGRGTSSLTVTGYPIVINATAVPVADFNIAFSAGGPNQVTSFQQIPGLYDLRLPASSSNVVFYTVTSNGTIDYDPSLDLCVSGRGTNVLTILCDPSAPPALEQLIADLQSYIAGLTAAAFKNSNPHRANTLNNKLEAILSQVEMGQAEADPIVRNQLFQDAMDKLTNDLRAKTDGCQGTGSPDANDWIVDCAAQAEVSLRIDRIIAAITALI